MAVKVGINGFGRIGKCVVRAAINNPDVEVVAINATGDNEGTALLLKYDSVHGTIPNEVTFDEENIYVDGKKFAYSMTAMLLNCLGLKKALKLLWNVLVNIVMQRKQRFI